MSCLKEFEVIATLGSGSFSSVYKVKRISDGQQYALKKVKFPNLKSKEKDNALNEVRILASISDANIIAYKQAFFDETSQSLCIIMELASGGDLYKKISDHKKKNERIPEETLWAYLIQMTQGLKTLHDMKILHRDLKSANVFLSSDGKSTKLGDLNVSKIAEKGLVHTQAGTPYYASPEVWQNKPYGAKSDIWSLGCVMYELCTFMPPFRAQSMNGLYQKIIKGSYDKIPSFYSQDLTKIISACLNVKPESRPSCEKILSHPVVGTKMTQEQIINSKRASTHNELLDTIKVPRLMKKLTQMLPKANYKQRETVSLIDLDAAERRPPSRLTRADSNINLKKDIKEDSLERVLKAKDVVRPAKKQSSLPPIDNVKKTDKATVIQRAALAVLSNALDMKTNLSGVRENNISDENKENERKNVNIYYNNDVRRNIRAVY